MLFSYLPTCLSCAGLGRHAVLIPPSSPYPVQGLCRHAIVTPKPACHVQGLCRHAILPQQLQHAVQSRRFMTNALSNTHCLQVQGLCRHAVLGHNHASCITQTGSTNPFPVYIVCYVQGLCRHAVFSMYNSDWLHQTLSRIRCLACAGVTQACSLSTAVAASCTTLTGCTKLFPVHIVWRVQGLCRHALF